MKVDADRKMMIPTHYFGILRNMENEVEVRWLGNQSIKIENTPSGTVGR
jgi:hypothetical protein